MSTNRCSSYSDTDKYAAHYLAVNAVVHVLYGSGEAPTLPSKCEDVVRDIDTILRNLGLVPEHDMS